MKQGRFPVSFSPLLHLPWLPGPSCVPTARDVAELINCQRLLIRYEEPVHVLICLRFFESLRPAQALCDVTEFHMMASLEEIFAIYICSLPQLLSQNKHA